MSVEVQKVPVGGCRHQGHWVGYKKKVDVIYWGTRCKILTGWVEDLMGRVRDINWAQT